MDPMFVHLPFIKHKLHEMVGDKLIVGVGVMLQQTESGNSFFFRGKHEKSQCQKFVSI